MVLYKIETIENSMFISRKTVKLPTLKSTFPGNSDKISNEQVEG